MSFRFKVTFFYNKGAEEIESLSYYVKSVELPVWNISTENRQRFGNTQYVIPTFDFGQSTLKIVFLETDNMSITYFLNGFLFNNLENADKELNLWNNCASEILKIKIDELDPSMRGTIVSNIYACHLKKLTTPHFTNANLGTPVEIEAEFVVRYKLNSITTEIGEEPRQIAEPKSMMSDIANMRDEEQKIKDEILSINTKMQALAFKDVNEAKKQQAAAAAKKKTQEELVAKKQKELQELKDKLAKMNGNSKDLMSQRRLLQHKIEQLNKARMQAGLKPILGLSADDPLLKMDYSGKGFTYRDITFGDRINNPFYAVCDRAIWNRDGQVAVELKNALDKYGIDYGEGTVEWSRVFTSDSVTSELRINDFDAFEARSASELATLLSDFQSLNQQLDANGGEQLRKDIDAKEAEVLAEREKLRSYEADLADIDQQVKELTDTNIYSASEKQGENVDKSYQGTGGVSPGEKVPIVMTEGRKDRTTTDFTVTDTEADALYNKYVQNQKKNKKEVASKEEYRNMLEKNAQKMDKALTEFKSILKAEGIGVWVEAYNDAGHAVGSGDSSSHTMGQKVDINFIDLSEGGNTGTKIVGGKNMTEDQLQKILAAAKKAGLVPNWETNKKLYGENSSWGDFALANAWTTKDGKVYYKEGFTSWTGVRSNADAGNDYQRSDMVSGAKKTKAESKKEQLGR